VANLRGSSSDHLAGRRIVLAISGSIAAVKTVELARELIRHGADVHAVMSPAATQIVGPEALRFATGNAVVTRLTGDVEHVALLGDVPDRADLLLVAPATANTVGKMALGIDDTPVTTCATVAFGNRVPVVVAPAMHDAMMRHPKVQANIRALLDLDVTWVEPIVDEKKAKLADVEAIVEAVIWRLARDDGPLAHRHCLVIGGATAEPVDPVRILTNRSSGKTAILLARELRRAGADVRLWYGFATEPLPADLADRTMRFTRHGGLMDLVAALQRGAFDQVWMPAAIADYVPVARAEKIASGKAAENIALEPSDKVIEAVHEALPDAMLVAWKAESDATALADRARERMTRYHARYIVANTVAAFGGDATAVTVFGADGSEARFDGAKADVMRSVVAHVSAGGIAGVKVAR
jgi:phosphopantothenoylcysteine decarboxylase/phosphopantothenate--cysteine ligase